MSRNTFSRRRWFEVLERFASATHLRQRLEVRAICPEVSGDPLANLSNNLRLIAVFLEAIVLIFKVAEDDIALTVYPTVMLFAGVAMLIGLGAFQRFAAVAERATGEHDDPEDGKAVRDSKGKKIA